MLKNLLNVVGIFIIIAGIIFSFTQFRNDNYNIGLAAALISIGMTGILWYAKDKDGSCGCISAIAFIIAGYLFFFAVPDFVKSIVEYPANVVATQKSYDVYSTAQAATVEAEKYMTQRMLGSVYLTLSLSNEKYEESDEGVITILIENSTLEEVKAMSITIKLPENFMTGFVVDYPKDPYCSINEGVLGYFQSISCNAIWISSGESISIVIPIIAKELGNYEGDISVSFSAIAPNVSNYSRRIEDAGFYRVRVVPSMTTETQMPETTISTTFTPISDDYSDVTPNSSSSNTPIP